MAQRTNALNHNGGTIKVGTTGTISSLMTRELESINQTCPPTQRKQQTAPVSIPCSANPRKALHKRNQINEQGSSSNYNGGGSSTGHTNCASNIEGQKLQHAPLKNGHKIPMLVSDGSPMDQTLNNCKAEKKAHSCIVEVVDLKCSNPMSIRLKKLGFSKLSESISYCCNPCDTTRTIIHLLEPGFELDFMLLHQNPDPSDFFHGQLPYFRLSTNL